jgi:multisubunit Na+/H+ antiporter MnhE subunit
MIRPLPVLGLAVIYALTLASVDPLDLATGTVVGIATVAYLRRFLDPGPDVPPVTLARLRRFPAFAWAVLREIAAGTWLVLMVVLGRRQPSQGIVAVPLGERSDTGVAVTALAINLSPGEVLVDVDAEARLMFVHVLDARDPDGIRARYDDFYDRYQRGLFP